MNKVATMTQRERTDLFSETSARMDIALPIIEKDFWVCWVLNQIFASDFLKGHLLFKGGTSLSKVFGLIRRFSEDVDLAVDWEMLGFKGERSPTSTMSKSKRAKLLEAMLEACRNFIAQEFSDELRKRFDETLGEGSDWEIVLDPTTPDSLSFRYPPTQSQVLSYIKPAVVLELGTHAEFIPNARFMIRPYASDLFPNIFDAPDCSVIAILAERTLWEKVTILHAEHYRPIDKKIPARYSRHYYDVAMIVADSDCAKAIDDHDLLRRVVEYKQRFYPSAWARYDLARPGTLRVVPPDSRLDALRQDYAAMKVMFFEEPPTFDTILDRLRTLEEQINAS